MSAKSVPGQASAWAFQWLEASGVKPGQWVVTIFVAAALPGSMPFSSNFPAVVDDLGNLVRVLEEA